MGADAGIDVAVIIVNYGTAELTISAVESVLSRDHGGLCVEVHVVDNASPGSDAAALRAAHLARNWGDAVTLHLEQVNHGFGRGNNIVLRALAKLQWPPEHVLFLNPDARLANDSIAILSRFLRDHPDAGAAGTRILREGDGVVTAAFRFPGLVSEFSSALAFGPIDRMLSRWRVPLKAELPTCEVDWVAGAAVMIRLRALQAIGDFDPDFFLYFEEVELMFRLRRAGWTIWHVAEAEIIHHEGAATGVKSSGKTRSPRPDYWYDSFGLYFRKTRGRFGAICVTMARLVGWGLNRPLAFLRGKAPSAPPGCLDASWRRILRPLLGLPPVEASK